MMVLILVDKERPVWIDASLSGLPTPPSAGGVSPAPLKSDHRFLKLSLLQCSNCHTVL
jgi:hypothetical protein